MIRALALLGASMRWAALVLLMPGILVFGLGDDLNWWATERLRRREW